MKPKTVNKYTTQLNAFKTWLHKEGYGNLKMNEVTKSIVTRFMNENSEKKKWSGKTYNDYLNNITTFFNYYHNNHDDIIDKVPTLHLYRAPVNKTGNVPFNDWQFKELKDLMLENDDHVLYTFCSFIYYAALRNESEGHYIKAKDFNFKTKTLRVEAGTAKNRTTEYIPIYPDFMKLLLELKVDQMHLELYIFGKMKDRRIRKKKDVVIGARFPVGAHYFALHFRKYKLAVGLEPGAGVYRYKHTRALHLGEDGEDLYIIMKLFRHKDLATTMIYLRGIGVNAQNVEYNKVRKF